MKARLPETGKPRIVIIGAGFAGLTLGRKLSKSPYQVVLIDKNNYHQFQPLIYQVATAGLEPSSISFPLRKIFQNCPDTFIRIAEVMEVNTQEKHVLTSLGRVNYDILVLAIGADTNYFGIRHIEELSIPMKTVSEALFLRNRMLQNFEDAISVESEDDREGLLTVVIAGGGPTGVEVAGALAEIREFIIPKDYRELDKSKLKIYLAEASDRLLSGMSANASEKSGEYLAKLKVGVITGVPVKDYDGKYVLFADGRKVRTNTLIWAAGVKANTIKGLIPAVYTRGNRIKVDRFNKVEGYDDIYAIGDLALMEEPHYPNGHPQLATVAIKQARHLAANLKKQVRGAAPEPFAYKHLGSMATVGRNLAVADLKVLRLHGFTAWLFWMFVHLMSIVGVKNRLLIFINWVWNYLTYDQSLRLIIKPKNEVPAPKKDLL
jgi:NADH:ubiquinone reductase (H+-translocating)